MHTLTCQNCGKEFSAKRADAKTCGTTCRTQARRADAERRQANAALTVGIRSLIVRAENGDKEAAVLFRRLATLIDDAKPFIG